MRSTLKYSLCLLVFLLLFLHLLNGCHFCCTSMLCGYEYYNLIQFNTMNFQILLFHFDKKVDTEEDHLFCRNISLILHDNISPRYSNIQTCIFFPVIFRYELCERRYVKGHVIRDKYKNDWITQILILIINDDTLLLEYLLLTFEVQYHCNFN